MSTTQRAASPTAKPGGFRDRRLPPFSYVTHVAIERLHAEFVGEDRKTAMAMYTGLAIKSSLARAGGGAGDFDATNAEIGEVAGLSGRTVERYAPRFEAIGLLLRECHEGRPSTWILVEPTDDEPPTPSRTTPDTVSGVDEPDPRHGVAPPATPSRTTPDTVSGVDDTRERQGGEEGEEEKETPQPPEGERPPAPDRPVGDRQRDWERYRQQLRANAGHCCLEPGSAPIVAESEWAELAPEIREVIGDTNFGLWLSAAHAHAGDQDELLIAVPELAYGWVRDRFAPAITQVAKRPIEIVVCEENR